MCALVVHFGNVHGFAASGQYTLIGKVCVCEDNTAFKV